LVGHLVLIGIVNSTPPEPEGISWGLVSEDSEIYSVMLAAHYPALRQTPLPVDDPFGGLPVVPQCGDPEVALDALMGTLPGANFCYCGPNCPSSFTAPRVRAWCRGSEHPIWRYLNEAELELGEPKVQGAVPLPPPFEQKRSGPMVLACGG